MHSEMWGEFAQQLSEYYQITLIDLPLHETLKQISDEIVTNLDSQSFYLMGWSLGGSIALDIAQHYPHRVQGVILLATNPCFVEKENCRGMSPDIFDAFVRQIEKNPTATLQRFLVLQMQNLPICLKEVRRRFALKNLPNQLNLETSLQLLKKHNFCESLKSLTCPIMAILSDDDTLVPVEIGKTMQELQPNLQLTILKNAGHIPFISQEQKCVEIVKDFLSKEQGSFLDKNKIKKSFSDASQTYDGFATLQREAGCDLLRYFLPENLRGTVVDLGCGTGFLTQLLLPHCKNVDLVAFDLALPMLQLTRTKINIAVNYICCDAESLAFMPDSIDTLFSNVALQWCFPIDKALCELQRVLKSDGTLIFSTFGSQTLNELKTAWQNVDDFAHVNEFYSAKMLQLALEKAGFFNIEIITKSYVSHYNSVLDLMRELKHIGAHNVNVARKKSVTTKRALVQMMANYPQKRTGEICATFEVLFVKASKTNVVK